MWHRLTSFLNAPPRHPKPGMETRLEGSRVILRIGDPVDWRDWRNLRESSRDFLTPWEPSWPANGLSYDFFCAILRRNWREWRRGTGYAFFIFQRGSRNDTGTLVGGITLSDVQRGISQKGTLGYWIGQVHAGQGYMSEAVKLVCDFAFGQLRLNRVEASCLPRNEPSTRLLQKLGFEEEGYAKAYMQINGKWEDHVLWGKRNLDLSSSPHTNQKLGVKA